MKLKKILQKIFNLFGYALIKEKNFQKLYRTLDKTIKSIVRKDNPVIFDVGGHNGGTIERFLKVYKKPEIHSFEPQSKCFENLKKFEQKNIIINNLALGDKRQESIIYNYEDDATTSLYKLNENREFSSQSKIISEEKVSIETLDSYVQKKKIDFIDILKIDAQCYEENILKGSINSLKDKVLLLEIKLIFVDFYEKKYSFYDFEKIINPLGFELFTFSAYKFTENNRIKWADFIYINKNIKI